MYINASKSSYKKWDTNSQPPLSKSIIPLPKAFSTNEYNQKVPKPWICVSTGYKIVSTRNKSNISGDPDSKTTPTTGRNIIQQRTIGT